MLIPKKLSTSRPEHLSHMPIVLYTWLIELDDESAQKVWEYLDGTGENSLEMIEALAESHPKIVANRVYDGTKLHKPIT